MLSTASVMAALAYVASHPTIGPHMARTEAFGEFGLRSGMPQFAAITGRVGKWPSRSGQAARLKAKMKGRRG